MNVKPTAQVIHEMAIHMADCALELRRIAEKMESSEDFSYAAEAAMAVRNAFSNLRIDLLVTRPVRELERLL